MSEHLLKFLVEELKIVRVRCMTCGGVSEVDLQTLGKRFMSAQCPLCNIQFGIPQTGSTITALAVALVNAQAAKDKFQVEFVLPEK